MRVLLVHNFYQTPGGEDRVVHQELSLLDGGGVEVDLFSVHNNQINGTFKKIETAFRTVYNPAARAALSTKLAAFSPDVVHIHNFFPLLSPAILDACRDHDVPAVITLHNYRILCPSALLYPDEAFVERSLAAPCWWTVPRRVYRRSAAATFVVSVMVEFHKRAHTWTRKVGRFIALTNFAKEKFVEGGLPSERIVVKPNSALRPLKFGELGREGALFVGRLDKQKGVLLLLQAWRDIDYPLRIIGDGPLSDLVRNNGNQHVRYLGQQPLEVVQREMQAARFLIIPSMGQEMFPVTILEAFASYLPVVCSDLPALREVVESGTTGLLFRTGDAAALAAQVHWAIANPSAVTALAERAHSIYEQRYTPEANFDRLMEIYHSLCSEQRVRANHTSARDHAGRHRRHSWT